MELSIYEAKTKVIFEYAKRRFCHDTAHVMINDFIQGSMFECRT